MAYVTHVVTTRDGRIAIKNSYRKNRLPVKGALDAGIKKAKLDTVEAEGHGDMAHEVGKYTLMGDGDKVLDTGKYVVVWKRQDGK